MRAGILDRRITIQRKTLTASGSGEPIETWATIAGCERRAASAPLPVRAGENLALPGIIATDQVTFKIRYSSEVATLNAKDRIIYPALDDGSPPAMPADAHIYDIIAVNELGRREGLSIIAQRRPDE